MYDRVRARGRSRSRFWSRRECLALPSRRYENVERDRPRSHVLTLTTRARATRALGLQETLSGCLSSVVTSPGHAHASCATAHAVIATQAARREANSLRVEHRSVPLPCALRDVSAQLSGRPLYGAPLVAECLAERRAKHTLSGRRTRRRPWPHHLPHVRASPSPLPPPRPGAPHGCRPSCPGMLHGCWLSCTGILHGDRLYRGKMYGGRAARAWHLTPTLRQRQRALLGRSVVVLTD